MQVCTIATVVIIHADTHADCTALFLIYSIIVRIFDTKIPRDVTTRSCTGEVESDVSVSLSLVE